MSSELSVPLSLYRDMITRWETARLKIAELHKRIALLERRWEEEQQEWYRIINHPHVQAALLRIAEEGEQ